MTLEVVDLNLGRRDFSPKCGFEDLSESESMDLMLPATFEQDLVTGLWVLMIVIMG